VDILILVALVGVLFVVSGCWGYDSRDGIRSKEQDLAARGFRWENASAGSPRGGRARYVPGVRTTPAGPHV
jgi:hypothetical protein